MTIDAGLLMLQNINSVLFVTLLVISLDTFVELPAMMLGRPVLQKQTRYRLYRPGAFALANTLADIPFSAVKILIYDIIIYFMVGLYRSAGAFFTFHLFNYLTYLVLQSLFRAFGLFFSNADTAFRIGVLFLPTSVLYSGFMIPVFAMKRWLFWLVRPSSSFTNLKLIEIFTSFVVLP